MSMPKGRVVVGGYSTVSSDDGINYREISEKLKAHGIFLKHSSVRNYVLRALKQFAETFTRFEGQKLSDEELTELARTPLFQSSISDFLHQLYK